MYIHLLLVLSITLFFTACGSGGGGGNGLPPPPDHTRTFNPNAFNSYDSSTFAASTCTNLPIETPIGIFVAPNGKSSGAGTQNDPLDLQTALSSSTSPANPGDTIWLAEGVYKGSFTSTISGTSGLPISIKPLPGKRAILDSYQSGINDAALRINGQWTNVYNIEASSSDPNRGNINEATPNVNAKSGIAVFGANNNIYNCLSYDNIGDGIDFWKTATDSTLQGNIIYNNGYSAQGRGHGHGIYTQNTTGTKVISNNIIFFGYQTGLHPYSTGSAPLNNYTIENNVWFLAGASDPRDNQQKTNLIIFTKAGVQNLLLRNNKGYSQVNRGSSLASNTIPGDATLENNYLVERLEVYETWNSFELTDNTIYGNITDPDSQINYMGGNILANTRPSTGKQVFVDANGIDQRRGRIVIYNYDNDDTVAVDLSSILKNGEAYRIHSVMGLFEDPILTGVYDGEPINIPMGTVAPPQPNGDNSGIDADDGPKKKFGVFIVTHGGCS